MSETAIPFTEMPTERDWVFARRFVVRRMIERGEPSAADHIPGIPEFGALQDEVERLRDLIETAHLMVAADATDAPGVISHAIRPFLEAAVESWKNGSPNDQHSS